MGELKKLTKHDYRELNSMREMVFNRFDEGKLDPLKYESLSSMVSEKKQEHDVSEFENFLDHHRRVYEMRKELG